MFQFGKFSGINDTLQIFAYYMIFVDSLAPNIFTITEVFKNMTCTIISEIVLVLRILF